MNQNTQYQDKLIYQGKWLNYHERHFTIGEKQIVWEFASRPNNLEGVEIIPIIHYKKKPKEILLISNFRVPIRQYCLEFPAGMLEDENIELNAIRELKEETGYTPKNIDQLHKQKVHYDPWKSTEKGSIVIANIDGDQECNQNPVQQLELDENIKVHKLPYTKQLINDIQLLATQNGYKISTPVCTFAMGLALKQ